MPVVSFIPVEQRHRPEPGIVQVGLSVKERGGSNLTKGFLSFFFKIAPLFEKLLHVSSDQSLGLTILVLMVSLFVYFF